MDERGRRPQRWYNCPHCGKALFPLREDTCIEHMPFRCNTTSSGAWRRTSYSA